MHRAMHLRARANAVPQHFSTLEEIREAIGVTRGRWQSSRPLFIISLAKLVLTAMLIGAGVGGIFAIAIYALHH